MNPSLVYSSVHPLRSHPLPFSLLNSCWGSAAPTKPRSFTCTRHSLPLLATPPEPPNQGSYSFLATAR